MNALLTSFISGMVFALGLGISGMTRPVKVIGFLDFFGAWDASLAFVMIGAIGDRDTELRVLHHDRPLRTEHIGENVSEDGHRQPPKPIKWPTPWAMLLAVCPALCAAFRQATVHFGRPFAAGLFVPDLGGLGLLALGSAWFPSLIA